MVTLVMRVLTRFTAATSLPTPARSEGREEMRRRRGRGEREKRKEKEERGGERRGGKDEG